MSKRYSFGEKKVIEAMKLYKEGKSPDEIIEKLGLPSGTAGRNLIGYWRKKTGIKAVNRYKNWKKILNKI